MDVTIGRGCAPSLRFQRTNARSPRAMRSRVASGDAYDWNDPSGGGSVESLALKYESPRTPSGAAPRTWRKPAVPPPVAYRLGLHAVAVVACAVVTQHWYALAPLGIDLLSQH